MARAVCGGESSGASCMWRFADALLGGSGKRGLRPRNEVSDCSRSFR